MKFDVQLEREGDSEMFEELQRYLKYHPRVTRFVFNPAGLTFVVGSLLFVGMVLGWTAIVLLDPPVAGAMAATLGAEVFPGKELATAIGIGFGLHPVIVFGIVFLQDLITTSWVYPLFYIFRKRQSGRDNFFGYLFTKIERDAKRHETFIKNWGAWGLFAFMLIPFAVNGPLIGAILGKLVGIRTRYILPALVGATALTTGYWVALWHYAHDTMQRIVDGPYGTWIQLAFLLLFGGFVLWTAQGFLRDRREFKRIQAERQALSERRQHIQTIYAHPEADAGPADGDRPA
jgi:uncharacterized membrane protein